MPIKMRSMASLSAGASPNQNSSRTLRCRLMAHLLRLFSSRDLACGADPFFHGRFVSIKVVVESKLTCDDPNGDQVAVYRASVGPNLTCDLLTEHRGLALSDEPVNLTPGRLMTAAAREPKWDRVSIPVLSEDHYVIDYVSVAALRRKHPVIRERKTIAGARAPFLDYRRERGAEEQKTN